MSHETLPPKDTFTKSTFDATDLEKIFTGLFLPQDPQPTRQDVILLEELFASNEAIGLDDIARKTRPRHVGRESNYLAQRIPLINSLYLAPLSARIIREGKAERMLSMDYPDDLTFMDVAGQLVKYVGDKKDPVPDRNTPHVKTFITNGETFEIQAQTSEGETLKPLEVRTLHHSEPPANAFKSEGGIWTVVVNYGNGKIENLGVKNIDYTIKRSDQAKLISQLLAHGSVPASSLTSNSESVVGLISYREQQILIFGVNRVLRQWGLEAVRNNYTSEEEGMIELRLANGDKLELENNHVAEHYEQDSNALPNRQRKRQPYHGKMRL